MIRLILASGSVYRVQLLREAGYDVTAIASEIDEPNPELFPDPEAALLHLAELKARATLSKIPASELGGRLIFAADTVGVAGNRMLGKPRDRHDARQMLMAISGTEHEVLTGWCLLRPRDQLIVGGVERTRITMREWTAAELEQYLEGGEWEGKCGAYGLQLPRDPFVTRMDGSAANVIGVPLERLAQVLQEFPTLSSPYHNAGMSLNGI